MAKTRDNWHSGSKKESGMMFVNIFCRKQIEKSGFLKRKQRYEIAQLLLTVGNGLDCDVVAVLCLHVAPYRATKVGDMQHI
jgi:hypothetical protein